MISFFHYLYNMIGGEKMLKGIDISRYQAGIDVGGLDVDFIIVKATEGVGYSDPNYVSYLNAAISSGKKIGLYHYARPDLGNTPEDEATWFLSKAKNYIGKAILVLDWEVPGSISNTEWAYQFLKSVYQLAWISFHFKNLCIVLAFLPMLSIILLALLPVGASKVISPSLHSFMVLYMSTTALIIVVFPVPGPPVIM